MFVSGLLTPLLIPFVVQSDLTAEWKTALSGFLAIGLPEVVMLAAAAILGKEGFKYLKMRLWRAIEPPEVVNPMRYRVGLVAFVGVLLTAWLQPYLETVWPGLAERRILIALLGDVAFAASLFMLGGVFWDKLTALFRRSARVVRDAPHAPAPTTAGTTPAMQPTLPLCVGLALIVLSLVLPVFIPVVAALPLASDVKTAVSGLMVFGIPQFIMLGAVVVLGKASVVQIKQRMTRIVLRPILAPVGPVRHGIGVALLVATLAVAVLSPYLADRLPTPSDNLLYIAIAGDALLLIALAILGREFWCKFGALFSQEIQIHLVG